MALNTPIATADEAIESGGDIRCWPILLQKSIEAAAEQ
jgi:hypothetical protein